MNGGDGNILLMMESEFDNGKIDSRVRCVDGINRKCITYEGIRICQSKDGGLKESDVPVEPVEM